MAYSFIANFRRTTMVLSRAKHGLFIHGNIDTLAKGAIWRQFFDAIRRRTFPITPENYMQALQNSNSSPLQSVPNTLPRPLFPPPQPLRPMFQPPHLDQHFGFYNPSPLTPLSAPRMMPTQVPLRPLTQTSSSNFFFAPPPPRRQ